MVKKKNEEVEVGLQVPQLVQKVGIFRLVGDTPLLINNKLSVAWAIAKEYGPGGKTGKIKSVVLTPEEQYANTFYKLPSSPFEQPHEKGLYGVPASGIRKCLQKGIRPAGFTDNTTVGLIQKAFRILDDEGGLCLIRHNGFSKDARPVNIGSGQKTVPQIRYRPIFPQWELHVRIIYNARILSGEQLCNLALHAGQYVGLCEMRAEKAQGECGGFTIEPLNDKVVPAWATDEAMGVKIEDNRFSVVQ